MTLSKRQPSEPVSIRAKAERERKGVCENTTADRNEGFFLC